MKDSYLPSFSGDGVREALFSDCALLWPKACIEIRESDTSATPGKSFHPCVLDMKMDALFLPVFAPNPALP
jgi:hypothetical protein